MMKLQKCCILTFLLILSLYSAVDSCLTKLNNVLDSEQIYEMNKNLIFLKDVLEKVVDRYSTKNKNFDDKTIKIQIK